MLQKVLEPLVTTRSFLCQIFKVCYSALILSYILLALAKHNHYLLFAFTLQWFGGICLQLNALQVVKNRDRQETFVSKQLVQVSPFLFRNRKQETPLFISCFWNKETGNKNFVMCFGNKETRNTLFGFLFRKQRNKKHFFQSVFPKQGNKKQ